MLRRHHHVTLQVLTVQRETERVNSYELADPDDWPLPPFTAGGHIDVHLDCGLVRPYSLCGDPAAANRYRIAVQREEAGRGGSVALHAQLKPGAMVSVSLPRNHFPISPDARRHVMIAGGIGITPFLAMMDALDATDRSYELHYCARSPADMAARGRMMAATTRAGCDLYFTRGDEPRRLDVRRVMKRAAPGAHIYCCGPASLIAEVLECAPLRPEGSVHVESFGLKRRGVEGDRAFVVELARSGGSIDVAPGQTIVEALREAGIAIDASCEAGACLVCKTRYLSGIPIHRDLVMKPEERRDYMTPCVSGCSSERLILDL